MKSMSDDELMAASKRIIKAKIKKVLDNKNGELSGFVSWLMESESDKAFIMMMLTEYTWELEG